MKSGTALLDDENLLIELEKSNVILRAENKALRAQIEQLLQAPNPENPETSSVTLETPQKALKVEDRF